MYNLAYFGSPDFSAKFLEKLLNNKNLSQLLEVKLTVTQPNRRSGRKQIITPTPVKQISSNYKINTVHSLGSIELDLKNIDIALVYAYAKIIPKELLNIPKYGFWCIHPSLLPKYRGTSPMATALINGDKITGTTIIKMDEKIDHGPIIAQESLTIENSDKRPELEKKLTELAFNIFKKIILNNDLNQLKLIPQDNKQATYTKKLTKEDGFIEFKKLKLKIKNSSEELFNLFRGLYPWPGIWTILPNNKRLKITKLSIKNKKLIIEKVQLEGKKEVDFSTFNQVYKIF